MHEVHVWRTSQIATRYRPRIHVDSNVHVKVESDKVASEPVALSDQVQP
jgi:hypothetical protein